MTHKTGKLTSYEIIFLVISLLLIPALILYSALGYLEKQQNLRAVEMATIEVMASLNQVNRYPDMEALWCAILNEELAKSKSADEMVEHIEELAEITNEKLLYIVWKNRQEIGRSNYLSPKHYPEWNSLLQHMKKSHDGNIRQKQLQRESAARKLLGPHYFKEHYNRSQSYFEPRLIRPDNARRFPMLWFNDGRGDRQICAMVFFPNDILKRDHRCRILNEYSQKKSGKLRQVNLKELRRPDLELKLACQAFIDKGLVISQFDNRLTGITRIDQDNFIASTITINNYSGNSGQKSLLITLLTIFLLIMLFRTRPGFLQPDNLSIRSQLLILLFVCSGLPLLALALGGLEHLKQQRDYLIRAAYQNCIKYLQTVDRQSTVELSRIIQKSDHTVEKFIELYKNKASEEELILSTRNLVHPAISQFRIVASTSHYLIADNGIYRNGKFETYTQRQFVRSSPPNDVKVLHDIGSYFISFINRTPVKSDQYTETELLTEMFYQKNLSGIVHDLLLVTGTVANMGWGTDDYPIFLKLISIFNPKLVDFFFLTGYNPGTISNQYIIRQTDNLLRNDLGLQVYLYNNCDIFPLNHEKKYSSELKQIFASIGTHPALEPKFCKHANKSWIYAGFTGNFLNSNKIMAMYPLEKIDRATYEEKRFIIYSALTAITIMISLTLLLAHTFTVPIAQLHAAAIAVEKRDFAFKLPDLGEDEFAEIGQVFNNSIAKLEELAIASIVQSRLMPARTIASDHFSIYGNTVPMADLGGDYYDYFDVSTDGFSVLLGDVAGHGVGASLIMAMAKAAVVHGRSLHKQPRSTLESLHKLICTTRSKTQRKIMTFQYLYFDKVSGVGKYANAGGCSPMLVCPKAATVTEITLPGPVLGGFKNSKFSEIDLQMRPGQALVLYTDGIIESKNPAGNEIGYERFKQWLTQHYNPDATKYYHAIYDEYTRWLDTAEVQDDLTLIILIYSNNKERADSLA